MHSWLQLTAATASATRLCLLRRRHAAVCSTLPARPVPVTFTSHVPTNGGARYVQGPLGEVPQCHLWHVPEQTARSLSVEPHATTVCIPLGVWWNAAFETPLTEKNKQHVSLEPKQMLGALLGTGRAIFHHRMDIMCGSGAARSAAENCIVAMHAQTVNVCTCCSTVRECVWNVQAREPSAVQDHGVRTELEGADCVCVFMFPHTR